MYFFRNILCLFICLDFGFAFTQTFNRTYGGTGTDRGNATIQAIDGNYLVAGSTTTSGAGGSDVYLIKNSPSKLSYWAKTFGGTGNDIGYSVARVSDGGYVIAGSTDSFGAGGLDVYLIKTDSNGGLLWSATFRGVADDAASCVIETADGGFAITGYTSSYGGGLKDVYLIKTNSDATSYWTKVFGAAGPYDDEGHSIIEDSNGDFVIAGYTRSFGSLGNDNGYIIKTNSSGTPIWSTVIGGANSDILYDIVQNTAGGYLAVGATKSLSWCNTGYNNYLVRIDNAGSVIEDLVLGWDNDEVSTSVIQLPTGSFVIAGYTRSFGAGLKDVLLYQFTFSPGANTVNWYKAIGGTGIDEAKSVVRASDGTLIVAGTTASFGAGGDEVFHINASSLGISSCNSVGTPFLSMCVDPLAVSTGTTSTTGGSSSSGGSTSNTSPVVAYNACTNIVLPVEILYLHAGQKGESVLIRWATAMELNNDYFEVERSVDGINYFPVHWLKGAGNSSIQINYEFTDVDLPLISFTHEIYYRIKQTDFNGATEYFGPASVMLKSEDGVHIFPNPTRGKFNLRADESFGRSKEGILVIVKDIFGKEYYSKVIFMNPGEQMITIDSEDKIPAGVYTVIAASDNNMYMKKLVIY